MSHRIEIEQEVDGRFLAEVQELPGVLAYGETAEDAIAQVRALALRVLAEHRTISDPEFVTVPPSET